MQEAPRIALALGSGGARGYAHIGAIDVLTERGFEIVGIAGASAGALMGGLHAAGALDEYTDWVRGLGRIEVLRLFDPALTAAGALRAEKVFAILRDLLGDRRIEDCEIPFTAVATDLFAHREVWFQEGPIDAAIRASIAIPSLITPVVHNGRVLVDGGMMNPVPIAPLSAVAADAVIAISLNGESHDEPELPLRTTAEEIEPSMWMERFRRTAARLLDSDTLRSVVNRVQTLGDADVDESTSVDAELTEAFDRAIGEVARQAAVDGDADADAEILTVSLGKLEMMNLTFEAMQAVLTRYRFAGYPPDVLVSVPKDAARTMDFHRADELIELGRRLTEEALDAAHLHADASADVPTDETLPGESADAARG